MATLKWLGIQEYDWLGRKDRSFTQWKVWNDYRFFTNLILLLAYNFFCFVCTFTTPNSLWIYPSNIINACRLALYILLGSIAFEEF
mmetsp:Transcript_2420/g.1519  ORF Transcript_2420/g.1519 Transcript_2420/m.1519 type:complete len:86 (-) Transcript_2420:331-588(-)